MANWNAFSRQILRQVAAPLASVLMVAQPPAAHAIDAGQKIGSFPAKDKEFFDIAMRDYLDDLNDGYSHDELFKRAQGLVSKKADRMFLDKLKAQIDRTPAMKNAKPKIEWKDLILKIQFGDAAVTTIDYNPTPMTVNGQPFEFDFSKPLAENIERFSKLSTPKKNAKLRLIIDDAQAVGPGILFLAGGALMTGGLYGIYNMVGMSAAELRQNDRKMIKAAMHSCEMQDKSAEFRTAEATKMVKTLRKESWTRNTFVKLREDENCDAWTKAKLSNPNTNLLPNGTDGRPEDKPFEAEIRQSCEDGKKLLKCMREFQLQAGKRGENTSGDKTAAPGGQAPAEKIN